MLFPKAEDTMYFRHRNQRSQALSDLNASYLRTSFHGIRWCHANFLRKEATNNIGQHIYEPVGGRATCLLLDAQPSNNHIETVLI